MNTEYISRAGFEAIFRACMEVKTIFYADGSEGEATPIMAIRDFDTCDPNVPNDVDFGENQLEEAWEYFEECDRCRVMDVGGIIYIDAFE